MSRDGISSLPPNDGGDDGKPTLAELNRRAGSALLSSFKGYDVCAIRSRCEYRKLLQLRKSGRARTLGQILPMDCEEDVSSTKEVKRLCFLHAKAEAMFRKQTARQRRTSAAHSKGLRRKTWRSGKGKGGCQLDMHCSQPDMDLNLEPEAFVYHPILGVYVPQEEADDFLGTWFADTSSVHQLHPENAAYFPSSSNRLPAISHRQRFQRWYRALEISEEAARSYRHQQPCRFSAWLEEARKQLCLLAALASV